MAAAPLLLLLFIAAHTADGFEHYIMDVCVFNSTELNDIQYIYSMYYNRLEILRFDSKVGEFVGYTELGVMNAKRYNSGSEVVNRRAERERYCLQHAEVYSGADLSKSAQPYVRVRSEAPPAGKHPAMLVCSVFDFYPKHIRVSWQRDGQEVTSDVTSTDELEDGDWYYQVHSHLEYTPRSGEKISCVVEHASLSKPLITDWDPSMPESEKNKIAIGASGLILGLTLSLAGFIYYYRKKSRGLILVPDH